MELIRIQDATLKTDRVLATNVSFTVRAGTRRIIVGANGSGKTTLLHALASARTEPTDEIRFAPGVRLQTVLQREERPLGDVGWLIERHLRPVREAERTVMRFAERTSIGATNLMRYQEALDAFEAMGGFRVEERLAGYLAEIDVAHTDALADITAEQWQLLRLALALCVYYDVLLLDEPTTGLTDRHRERLQYWLQRYPGAIITVSHDRAFMRAFGGTVNELTTSGLQPFVIPPARTSPVRRADWSARPLVHRAEDGVSFIVRAGDRIAIEDDAERLFAELAGTQATSGTLRFKHALTLRTIASGDSTFPVLPFLRAGSVTGAPEEMLQSLGLPRHRWYTPVNELSGGEQRRVMLARALLDEAEVILIPDATAGLDLPGMVHTENALLQYTEKHPAAILFTSTDAEFTARVANRHWPEPTADVSASEPFIFEPGELVSREEEVEAILARTEEQLRNRGELRERVVRRLLAERTVLSGDVMERLNRTLPQPRARFRTIEDGTEFFADTQENGRMSWVSTDPYGADPAFVLHHFSDVGHVQDAGEPVPGALNALVHYAFLYGEFHAVQWQPTAPPTGVLLQQDGNWWRLTRREYEKAGGWFARPQ